MTARTAATTPRIWLLDGAVKRWTVSSQPSSTSSAPATAVAAPRFVSTPLMLKYIIFSQGSSVPSTIAAPPPAIRSVGRGSDGRRDPAVAVDPVDPKDTGSAARTTVAPGASTAKGTTPVGTIRCAAGAGSSDPTGLVLFDEPAPSQ